MGGGGRELPSHRQPPTCGVVCGLLGLHIVGVKALRGTLGRLVGLLLGRPLGQVLRRRVVACRLRVPCWRRWRGVAGARVADGRWRVGWCIGLRGRGPAGPATLQLLGRWVACGSGSTSGGVSRVAQWRRPCLSIIVPLLRHAIHLGGLRPRLPAAAGPYCNVGYCKLHKLESAAPCWWVHSSVDDRSGGHRPAT
jgi:hypothetical protein